MLKLAASASFLALLIATASSAPDPRLTTNPPQTNPPTPRSLVTCDVIVAGGSLASTAAALAAGAANASLAVCLLDLTDWVGGQMTASATSAIDWGSVWDRFPANTNRAFADLMLSAGLGGAASVNPGGCTVSTKCFAPVLAVEWLNAALAALPSVHVYLNTAVVNVSRDTASGRVTGLTAVQRFATAAHPSGWDRLLSEALPDWYSAAASPYFSKQVLDFVPTPSGVVVDATEWGDVLVLGGQQVAQGIEVPIENAAAFDDHCGQAATICFWLGWDHELAPSPDPTPRGSDVGYPLPYAHEAWSVDALNHALTWRRSLAVNRSDVNTPRRGDLFLINEQSGNDLLNAQIMLPLAVAHAQAAAGLWAGGINVTALAMAEQRAYAYYHDLVNGTRLLYPDELSHTSLNLTAAGTLMGLAKMPYMRESRRALRGIDGFRLCSDFAQPNGTGPGGPGCWRENEESMSSVPRGCKTGFRWVDTVGIGLGGPVPRLVGRSYGFDQHRFNANYCRVPAYLNYSVDPGPSVPYYIPFRALTVEGASNLLVAGKTMAQTFYANAVTRLHPTEWASGTAAGAAAALMAAAGLSSADMYDRRAELQTLLKGPLIRQPLEWTL